MQYRQQESQEQASPIFGTTAGLADRCDVPKMKVSRWFREVDNAARFMQLPSTGEDVTGRIIRYSNHKNDVRVVVTYLGNVPKSRVKTSKARYIVKDGVNVNRLLPTLSFGEI